MILAGHLRIRSQSSNQYTSRGWCFPLKQHIDSTQNCFSNQTTITYCHRHVIKCYIAHLSSNVFWNFIRQNVRSRFSFVYNFQWLTFGELLRLKQPQQAVRLKFCSKLFRSICVVVQWYVLFLQSCIPQLGSKLREVWKNEKFLFNRFIFLAILMQRFVEATDIFYL